MNAQKHLYLFIGLDAYRVIDLIMRQGKEEPRPKSTLIALCFNIPRKEGNLEYAEITPTDGYPFLVLKTPADDRELFEAEVFARSRCYRVGRQDDGLYLALGFSPKQLAEMQEANGA